MRTSSAFEISFECSLEELQVLVLPDWIHFSSSEVAAWSEQTDIFGIIMIKLILDLTQTIVICPLIGKLTVLGYNNREIQRNVNTSLTSKVTYFNEERSFGKLT